VNAVTIRLEPKVPILMVTLVHRDRRGVVVVRDHARRTLRRSFDDEMAKAAH
jgi:regulator of RNase E activity RraA